MPPKERMLDLRFPVGGLNHRQGYQSQPPFTSPEAVNVRAFETEEGRERGGQRPGLGRSHVPAIGAPDAVRMLATCNVVRDTTRTYWQDDFLGSTVGSLWNAPPGGLVLIDDALHVAYAGNGAVLGAMQSLSDLDATLPYQVAIFVVPNLGEHRGTYRVWANFSSYADLNNGWELRVILGATSGSYSGGLYRFNGGVSTEVATFSGTFSGDRAGWLVLRMTDEITGPPTTYAIRAWVFETQVVSVTAQPQSGSTDHFFGFGLTATGTAVADLCMVNAFRIAYNASTQSRTTQNVLVASAGGLMYQESTWPGFIDSVSVGLSLASTIRVRAADRGQRLYLADRSAIELNGTDGVVAAGVMTAASVSLWSAVGAAQENLLVVITAGTGSVTNGTYALTYSGANLTITGMTGTGNCSYRVGRGPKVYDPVAETLVLLAASTGQVPVGAPLVARWRDRMVWAGPGHEWFMSRQSDPLDYDYGADGEDAQRAVNGTLAAGGTPGEPITALMPFTDDVLLMGCARSLWRYRGDPAYGGRLDVLSSSVGVVGGDAWAYGPNGELYFIGTEGLFRVMPDGSQPEYFGDRWGRRLGRELDPMLYDVQLAYEPRDRGLHVFVTARDVRYSALHAWVDLANGALWPVAYGASTPFTNHEPTSSTFFQSSTPFDSGVVLGCRDGALRRFHELFGNDEGEEIQSLLEYGPLSLGPIHGTGTLLKLQATLGTRSGGVRFRVRTGLSGEAAFLAAQIASASQVSGVNPWWGPRVTGAAFILQLENEENRTWQLESIRAHVREAGLLRP